MSQSHTSYPNKGRNSNHRALNADTLCGSRASSQPTSLTTINGRLNVRNAITPKQ